LRSNIITVTMSMYFYYIADFNNCLFMYLFSFFFYDFSPFLSNSGFGTLSTLSASCSNGIFTGVSCSSVTHSSGWLSTVDAGGLQDTHTSTVVLLGGTSYQVQQSGTVYSFNFYGRISYGQFNFEVWRPNNVANPTSYSLICTFPYTPASNNTYFIFNVESNGCAVVKGDIPGRSGMKSDECVAFNSKFNIAINNSHSVFLFSFLLLSL
jgi:hypothetical protein